jgi:hypothetical protein
MIHLKGTKTFTIDDLPPHTDKNEWDVLIVPSFIHYFARYGEPWESNGYLEFAQYLWDAYFPNPPMVLTRNEDAVYPLVGHNDYFHILISFLSYYSYANVYTNSVVLWLTAPMLPSRNSSNNMPNLTHQRQFENMLIGLCPRQKLYTTTWEGRSQRKITYSPICMSTTIITAWMRATVTLVAFFNPHPTIDNSHILY